MLPLEIQALIFSYTDIKTIIAYVRHTSQYELLEDLYQMFIKPKIIQDENKFFILSPQGGLYIYTEEDGLQDLHFPRPVKDITVSGYVLDIHGNVWKDRKIIRKDIFYIYQWYYLYMIDKHGYLYKLMDGKVTIERDANRNLIKVIDDYFLGIDGTVTHSSNLGLYKTISYHKNIRDIAVSGELLYFLDENNNLYKYDELIQFNKPIKSIDYSDTLYITDTEENLWKHRRGKLFINMNERFKEPTLKAVLFLKKTYIITQTKFIIKDDALNILYEHKF